MLTEKEKSTEAKSRIQSGAAAPTQSLDSKFESLVRKYSESVFLIGYSRLRSVETAEDLVQEVFIRALLQFDWENKPEEFGPWVCRVASNLSIDWQRKSIRRADILPLLPLSEEITNYIRDESDGPQEKLADKEQIALMDELLELLEEEEKQVVLLHYYQNLTKKEIANRLQLHPSTVGRQIKHSIKKLKQFENEKEKGRVDLGGFQQRLSLVLGGVGALSLGEKSYALEILRTTAGLEETLASSNLVGMSAGTGAKSIITKGGVIMGAKKAVALVSITLVLGMVTILLLGGDKDQAHNLAEDYVFDYSKFTNQLPPLPEGWVFQATPNGQSNIGYSVVAGNPYRATGMPLNGAVANGWSAKSMIMHPDLRRNKLRYDFVMSGPSAVWGSLYGEVLQSELQRLYKLRVFWEKIPVRSLVVTAPNGVPDEFVPSTAMGGSVSAGILKTEFRRTSMKSFFNNVEGNRDLPVFNETGLEGAYDLDAPRGFYKDRYLEKLGFQLKYEVREVDVLIVVPEELVE